MGLKLEALSAIDGTGIVRNGYTLRLLRPPYTHGSSPLLPEESIQDAILRHGFSASQQEFESWESAIDFLNEMAVEARRSIGAEIPDSVSGAEIVEVAPEEVLVAFLQRVEAQLIPQGLFEHAENFLLTFLNSGAATRYSGLTSKAAGLLQRCKDAQRRGESKAAGFTMSDPRYQSLKRHGEVERSYRLAEEIRKRGSVLAPCY
jgi:hypothetical protein